MMSCATRSCSDIDGGTPAVGAVLWVLFADFAAPAADGGAVAPIRVLEARRTALMSREESICLHYSDGNPAGSQRRASGRGRVEQAVTSGERPGLRALPHGRGKARGCRAFREV